MLHEYWLGTVKCRQQRSSRHWPRLRDKDRIAGRAQAHAKKHKSVVLRGLEKGLTHKCFEENNNLFHCFISVSYSVMKPDILFQVIEILFLFPRILFFPLSASVLWLRLSNYFILFGCSFNESIFCLRF